MGKNTAFVRNGSFGLHLSMCHRKSLRHMLVNFPVSVTDS